MKFEDNFESNYNKKNKKSKSNITKINISLLFIDNIGWGYYYQFYMPTGHQIGGKSH